MRIIMSSDGSRNPHVLNFGAAKEFTDRVPLGELNERYGLTVEQVNRGDTLVVFDGV